MKSASQLLEEVKNERNREDKFLCEIQFEVRRNEVTMFLSMKKFKWRRKKHIISENTIMTLNFWILKHLKHLKGIGRRGDSL
ncbi:hypothetical protein AAHB43_11490 [Staphylococcus pseudintermedius]